MATTAVEMAVAAGMATTARLATATVWRQRGGSGRVGGGSVTSMDGGAAGSGGETIAGGGKWRRDGGCGWRRHGGLGRLAGGKEDGRIWPARQRVGGRLGAIDGGKPDWHERRVRWRRPARRERRCRGQRRPAWHERRGRGLEARLTREAHPVEEAGATR
uniref:Uncharacterized protein n=1 Tax=Oryza glumipatula TaxID=40148 RepID=A0A0D9ZZ41_9ORYZ